MKKNLIFVFTLLLLNSPLFGLDCWINNASAGIYSPDAKNCQFTCNYGSTNNQRYANSEFRAGETPCNCKCYH